MSLVIVILIIGGTVLYSVHRHDKNQTAYSDGYTEQRSSEGYEVCFAPFSASETTNCIADQIRAEYSGYKDHHDLNAQQDMELWAFGAFLFGGFSFFATVIAASLIWRTHTDTRRIGQAETRAYVSATGGRYHVSEGYLVIDVWVRNTGNSPAESIRIHPTISANVEKKSKGNIPKWEPLSHKAKTVKVRDMQAAGSGKASFSLDYQSADTRLERIIDAVNNGKSFDLSAEIRWKDVFDIELDGTASLTGKRESDEFVMGKFIIYGTLTDTGY